MVLHGFSNKAKPIWNNDWKEARLMDGIKLFDIAKQTRPHHAWLNMKLLRYLPEWFPDLKFTRNMP
jgi:hypothetical protein